MESQFAAQFGHAPTVQTTVPGRVNLLGEWTDFSGGLVLPMAVPLHVRLALAPNGRDHDRVASAQFDGVVTRPVGKAASGHWSDYVAGALAHARAQGWADPQGYDVALDSTVPHGSGLSSSAAVIVGMLRMLAPEGTPAPDTAVAARAVENEYIGVPCGIMDQMAVAIAAPGDALAHLKTGDIAAFGAAMRDGQRSISTDFAITTPEVDAQVALIERHGALAARQTGGGFGGCIVVLDHAGDEPGWWEPLHSAFPAARRIV